MRAGAKGVGSLCSSTGKLVLLTGREALVRAGARGAGGGRQARIRRGRGYYLCHWREVIFGSSGQGSIYRGENDVIERCCMIRCL